MTVDAIRKYCMSFPEATENLQWGDDLCFKIRGKIFATLALTAIPQKLCFKCAPEAFADLIERPDIRPAPYVGRYKWVILERLDALSTLEREGFIRQSYEMVASSAPQPRAAANSRSKNRRSKKTNNAAKGRSRPRTTKRSRD